MNTKRIPALMTLSAGALTSIITFVKGIEIKQYLLILALVLVLFYALGVIIKMIFDVTDMSLPKTEEEVKNDEGSVIEKEVPNEGDSVITKS